jgi:hypothetical protein
MKQSLTKPEKAVEVVHPYSGLTALQEKCAILLASGIRITDAAVQVGTSRASIYRWMEDAAFICFYNQMKKEVQNYVEGALLDLHQKALDGIKASLDSTREEVRLRASMWVVEKVSQMPIGDTSIRKVLQRESEQEAGKVDWWVNSRDKGYQQRLLDAGLEE